MLISINPTLSAGDTAYEKIFSFHSTSLPNTFRQDTDIPFILTIMSIRPSDMEKSAISTFTPDAQFNLPISSAIKGRSLESMHQHNCFEFNYVLKGRMYLVVNGKRYLYTPGSCCLVNRDTLHTELPENSDYVCIFFSVSRDFIKQLMNYGNSLIFLKEKDLFANVIFQFFRENLQNEHQNKKDFWDFVPLITETEQKKIIHNIFEEMVRTMLSPRYGSTYMLQYLFLQLIGVLCNPIYYNAVHVTSGIKMDSLLFARIDQLLAEYHGRISNRELAKLLNYDGSYLGKIIKKRTGKSLFRYSMTFTMSATADLLNNTDLSVSKIALKLKFTNRAHFYKLFKEYYGMTPTKYRKE